MNKTKKLYIIEWSQPYPKLNQLPIPKDFVEWEAFLERITELNLADSDMQEAINLLDRIMEM